MHVAVRPILILNPRSDSEFVAIANALVHDGVTTAERFQERLRERFSRAVVHERELSGESLVVWYVYRDGRWRRNGDGMEADARNRRA